jgi:nitrogen fixation protein NifX
MSKEETMALQRQLKLLRPDSEEASPMDNNGFHVAFASADLKKVDQHFGSAERFAIYDVQPDELSLVEVIEFGDLAQDGNENKLLEKFVVLDGCLAVYCLAVGPSAVRQLMSLGIQPLKVQYGTSINGLLKALQQELVNGPGGWLARSLASRQEKNDSRFDQMEEEGWCE